MKRSSLLLIELISMVLIFSLCAAICLSIIGKAWSISKSSERLTHAVYLAQSAAAHIQSNQEYNKITEDDYSILIEKGALQGGVVNTLISVSCQGELVYSLTVTCQGGET